MRLGYNTNGLADHDLVVALDIVGTLGYSAVGITLNYGSLNPFDPTLPVQRLLVGEMLEQHDLLAVVETGGRYLLDPWHKHQPTLVSAGRYERAQRLAFLMRAVDIAADLGAHAVSFWSGKALDEADTKTATQRLLKPLGQLISYAVERGVRLAFEPEPGMAIDTMASFKELLESLDSAGIDSSALGLTLDVGHLHCLGEGPIAEVIEEWSDRLVNVHIEDMRAGVHEHLMFGEGEIDFPPIFEALRKIGYTGPVQVELSRHSPTGPDSARRAIEFLRPLL